MTDANAIMYVGKGPAYLQRKEQRNLSTDKKKMTGDLNCVNFILLLFPFLLKVYHPYIKSGIDYDLFFFNVFMILFGK